MKYLKDATVECLWNGERVRVSYVVVDDTGVVVMATPQQKMITHVKNVVITKELADEPNSDPDQTGREL